MKTTINGKKVAGALALATVLAAGAACADGSFVIGPKDRLAFVGDSITEMTWPGWTVYVESYLVQAAGCADTQFLNNGFGGWCSYVYIANRDETITWWDPTAVSVMYGTNDSWDGVKAKENFRKHMTDIVQWFKARGARCLVASPTVCNPWRFSSMRGYKTVEEINDTMMEYGKVSMEVAKAEGQVGFYHQDKLLAGLVKAHDVYGTNYLLTADTVHFVDGSDFLMASLYLKEYLPKDYNLGTLEMDYADGTARGGEFHSVKKVEKIGGGGDRGVEATFVSARYPIRFEGIGLHKTKPEVLKVGLAGQMVELTDFQQTLNRLTLKVKNLPAGDYNVVWGGRSVRVAGTDLAAGVNLTELFPVTPFNGVSGALFTKVQARQRRDVSIARFFMGIKKDPKAREKGLEKFEKAGLPHPAAEADLKKAFRDQHAVWVKESHAPYAPQEHTIRIVPVKK